MSSVSAASIQVCGQYFLIYLIVGLVATFTPGPSPLRPAGTAIILALAISIQMAAQSRTTALPFYLQMTAPLGAWIQFFDGLDILIHRCISYAEHRRWKGVQKADADADFSSASREAAYFALSLPYNFRRIGTKWQVSPIYAFKGMSGPSRAQFIQEKVRSVLFTLCAAALVYCLCSWLTGSWSWRDISQPPEGTTELCAVLDHTSLLDIPWQSLFTLIPISLLLIAAIFTTEKLAYNILSIVAASLRISKPVEWPPFQASLREAWSVRRFWGRFWRQAFRSFLTSNADFVVSKLPFSLSSGHNRTTTRIARIPSRYARHTLCFLISGLIHHLFDLGMRIPPNESGALRVFLVQPLAFAIDDIAGYFSRRFSVLTRDKALRRGIGYVWALLFSAWTWHVWTFPMLKRALEAGEPGSSGYFAWMGCGGEAVVGHA